MSVAERRLSQLLAGRDCSGASSLSVKTVSFLVLRVQFGLISFSETLDSNASIKISFTKEVNPWALTVRHQSCSEQTLWGQRSHAVKMVLRLPPLLRVYFSLCSDLRAVWRELLLSLSEKLNVNVRPSLKCFTNWVTMCSEHVGVCEVILAGRSPVALWFGCWRRFGVFQAGCDFQRLMCGWIKLHRQQLNAFKTTTTNRI